MLNKLLNSNGQKSHQRQDSEDRSLVYRNWLRGNNTNKIWFDVDLVGCTNENGKISPKIITELTRVDSEEVVGQGYLDAIINRWFVRDSQAMLIESVAKILGVPVYLVLYPPSVGWLNVYSFNKKFWKLFTPDEWVKFLQCY